VAYGYGALAREHPLAREPRGMYHSHHEFGVSIIMRETETTATLRLLSDRVIESPELEDVVRLLTHDLPRALGLPRASFMLWNRNLDAFEGLAPGETKLQAYRPENNAMPAPRARYLLSDGTLLDLTHGTGMPSWSSFGAQRSDRHARSGTAARTTTAAALGVAGAPGLEAGGPRGAGRGECPLSPRNTARPSV